MYVSKNLRIILVWPMVDLILFLLSREVSRTSGTMSIYIYIYIYILWSTTVLHM